MAQADLTRQRLVRAALELFTSVGYHLTTTPLIAKKAGVAEGTIYRHFDSKQHLLNELYRAAGRWAGKVVKEADALKVGPREKLAELARGLVAGAEREPAVARLFFLQRHADLLDEESHKVARDFRLGLESLIAQGKADGTVKPGAAEVWAAVWLGVVTLVVDRAASKEWPGNHAGVTLHMVGLDACRQGRDRRGTRVRPWMRPRREPVGALRSDCVFLSRNRAPIGEHHARRNVNSSISGGANTRIGTPTTPIPRLTYSWLFPRWKWPITYLVISRPGDQPIPGM